MPPEDSIRVVGARVHNLKNLNVAIPLNALTVVTGVSGSGKSSLAFDTLYAEGQRRYVESLSAYARQFLERMEKPDVDAIEGIAPAVAIRQKAGSRNPRSTVATATEIYDYLRLLYARAGTTYCPNCGIPVERSDVDRVTKQILEQAGGQRAYILFPVRVELPPAPAAAPSKTGRRKRVSGEAGAALAARNAAWAARLGELRAKGFNRLWQNGQRVEFSTPESLLQLDFEQPVFVLVDRLAIEPETRSRLVDGIEIAYREAGEVSLALADQPGAAPLRFSLRFECNRCGRRFQDPEPRLFSFNNPFGACPRCQGFGNTTDIAVERVIPDPNLSLHQGAIEPWNKPRGAPWRTALKKYAPTAGIDLDTPWRLLSAEQRRKVWEGDGRFTGVAGFFEYLERKKYKVHVRVLISRYRGYALCPECRGARLRPEALAVYLDAAEGRRNLPEVAALTVEQALEFFRGLRLTPEQEAVAAAVLIEVRRRLEFLLKVGLDYLTLDRLAATLSGGEAQRIQLATCLGSQLVGSLYVLDEPSIGLHPRDTHRLIAILRELRDLGNTILVVEHDPDVMRASDRLLDLGPAAGELGGELVAEGTWQEVQASPASLTGQYLRGDRSIPVPATRRSPGRKLLTVQGAYANNLKNLSVEIPLGMLVAVTGVSGSGKSTLVHQVLHRNLRRLLRPAEVEEDNGGELAGCRGIAGYGQLNEVILVDQSPIGRTPRSNPVTYMKAFDGIRELLARQPEAKKRGYKAGHFSFNLPGGRCETCQGEGVVAVDMQFLADVELVCEECNGTRYQAALLEVRLNGKNVHDILQMTVQAAIAFFAGQPKIERPLRLLQEIGLGYLRLGQSATTLSGGEAQRMKLAAHLAQPHSADRSLFLFDEPTTGLHFDDIAKLLAALQRLIAAGGSVLVIEHNLEVIKTADWVLELGPEAGENGGRLVAEGPPEWVAGVAESRTAPFLAPLLPAAR
ncbi:MAG TPA: excinuclease ABC subunit UvrA [Terriglobales bacterium]|nr:excinuclease ABC subunit UvrA [Terriglobales bacterium]